MSNKLNQNKPVLINGCLCKIQINKTDGSGWKLENANFQNHRKPILRDFSFLISYSL
jgi:hypothetical protein